MTEAEDFEFEVPKPNVCRLIKAVVFREELRYQRRCNLKELES